MSCGNGGEAHWSLHNETLGYMIEMGILTTLVGSSLHRGENRGVES